MKERFKAAKEELDFDRSSFYLGIFVGVILAVVLMIVLPLVFGSLGGVVPSPSDEPKDVAIHADVIVRDLQESDNRVLIQLVNETNADRIYVVSDSDKSKLTGSHYLGGEGSPEPGSTVTVSIGVRGGDVYAQSGDTVKVIAVRKGHEEVIEEFTV